MMRLPESPEHVDFSSDPETQRWLSRIFLWPNVFSQSEFGTTNKSTYRRWWDSSFELSFVSPQPNYEAFIKLLNFQWEKQQSKR